jgi:hypothetical protein
MTSSYAPLVPVDNVPVTIQNVIKSYLYWEYNDDDDIQAFVNAYNTIAQEYLDILNGLNLPIYTNINVTQTPPNLLDWVCTGLYGYPRPVLPTGLQKELGPYDTVPFNTLQYNQYKIGTISTYYATTDDVYKRCLTWHFFKGDGKYFDVRWLKRRLMRFLYGTNGVNYNVDQTYPVSVSFAGYGSVDIILPNLPMSATLKAALDSGVLELPFQFTFNVSIA